MIRIEAPKRRWPWIVTAVVLVAALGVMGFLWLHRGSTPASQQARQEAPRAPKLEKLSSNTLFMGNIYWGRYINDWSRASELGTAYPFSRLGEFDRKSYQNWVAGLECPLVESLHLTSAQEEATLSFNCSPEYLPQAAKWFDIVTLANNHTDNQGPDGFAETKRHLDEQHMQYFGHYDPRALEDICDVISLKVVAEYDDKSTKPAQLPVAFCGYHGVFRIPTEEALAVMERYSKVMPVIAMPHAGAEYKAEPDELKTDLYRSMIDHGADVVIGDHPHWIQTTEAYKGKLIVYSMGNFIFDQQFNREVTRSAAIRMVLGVTGDSTQLEAWTKLGVTCTAYHDTCLEEAEKQQLPKLDATYRYAALGSSNQGRLAHPANADEQRDILQRLRWDQTMSGLQAPHGKL